MYTRQKDIFNPANQRINIKIIGAGSTGSFITLNLAKMGFKDIEVWDFDKVEEENIPNQFYRLSDVGKFKVDALKEIVKDFTGIDINTKNFKIENHAIDFDLNSVIILCVDNIPTRKVIYEMLSGYPISLIDTRMGGNGYQIYNLDMLNPKDNLLYGNILEEKTSEAPCGQKAIIYTVLSLASEVCNIVKRLDLELDNPKILKREMSTYLFLKK